MDAEALLGLVGVVLGAGLSIVGTWRVSLQRERLRDYRRLIPVLTLVAVELKENRDRLVEHAVTEPQRRMDLLRLGDWAASKITLVELMREESHSSLLYRVFDAYAVIEDALRFGTPPPDPNTLDEIMEQLLATREEFARRIDSARLLRRF